MSTPVFVEKLLIGVRLVRDSPDAKFAHNIMVKAYLGRLQHDHPLDYSEVIRARLAIVRWYGQRLDAWGNLEAYWVLKTLEFGLMRSLGQHELVFEDSF